MHGYEFSSFNSIYSFSPVKWYTCNGCSTDGKAFHMLCHLKKITLLHVNCVLLARQMFSSKMRSVKFNQLSKFRLLWNISNFNDFKELYFIILHSLKNHLLHHFGVKCFTCLCLVLFKVDLLPSSVCCCTVTVGFSIMSVFQCPAGCCVLLLKFLWGCYQITHLHDKLTHTVFMQTTDSLLYEPLWS